MEIRTIPLDDQDQYSLDGAVSCGEILPHTNIALGLYGDPDRISTCLTFGEHYWPSRRRACLALGEYGDEIMRGLPVDRQEALVALSVRGALRLAEETARSCSRRVIEQRTGGMVPFCGPRALTGVGRDGRLTKGVRRAIISPSFIARQARHDSGVLRLRGLAERLFAYPITESAGTMRAITEVHIDLGDQLAAFRQHYIRNRPDQGGINRRANAALRRIVNQKPLPYTVVRKQRKVVKRAAVMAVALLGASTVGAFARGEPVILPGSEVALSCKLVGTLDSIGHSRLAVDLLDKTGDRLGSLCVYVDGTPALDQLSAFALHMSSGLEGDLVNTANFIEITDTGRQHPAVLRNREAGAEAGAILRQRFEAEGRPMRQQQSIQGWYWQQTADLWLREVHKVAFGRNSKSMISLLANEALAPGYDLPIPEEVAGLEIAA